MLEFEGTAVRLDGTFVEFNSGLIDLGMVKVETRDAKSKLRMVNRSSEYILDLGELNGEFREVECTPMVPVGTLLFPILYRRDVYNVECVDCRNLGPGCCDDKTQSADASIVMSSIIVNVENIALDNARAG